MIRFANAPCSWGTIEGWGQGVPYAQMLDELVQTGYTATELSDYGYMPTEPAQLRFELESRGLTMLGAYEGVNLSDPNAYPDGEARVLRIAQLLKSVADLGDSHWQPLAILADQHSLVETRFNHAGRIQPSMMLPDWRTFATGANRLAKTVLEQTGLRTVFHPHCAGWVETPDEIAAFLDHTDPSLVGLVFDTGHYLFGTGANQPQAVLDGLERFKQRIWYMHFKDMNPDLATQARLEGWNYKKSVEHGIFCELGAGIVPFPAVLQKLEQIGYHGWVTVEQDVLSGMGAPFDSANRNRQYLKRIAPNL